MENRQMNRIKIVNMLFLVLLSLASCAGVPKQAATNPTGDITKLLYDNWYVKDFSSMPISALSDEEAQRFLEQSISLQPKIAIVLNDTCASPDYSIKKVHANTYLRYYKTSREAIGIKSDTIYTVDLTCKTSPKYFSDESPEFNYALIYDGSRLSIIYNGIVFHLKKKPIMKKSNIAEGDTVKCMYYQNKRCTGYIIQGTRKKGKPVHVAPPANKNVPLESQ